MREHVERFSPRSWLLGSNSVRAQGTLDRPGDRSWRAEFEEIAAAVHDLQT
jgi:hypothetical protein